ncbi:Uncharacterised protein [Klebsiella pneumoniae subsp. rhinoscleromatis]|nr:Uncharacterised protein [Klebsiella pneumoniae subsp. rhinoscleromatis]
MSCFKYARWRQKNNLINWDKTVDAEIARLYRIAAENGPLQGQY